MRDTNTDVAHRTAIRRLRLPIALVAALAIALGVVAVSHTGGSGARSHPRPVTIDAALAVFGVGSNLYLKLDPILGDVTDDRHANEIDIDSFSWGVANAKANPKNATFNALEVTKGLDSASPKLLVAVAQGTTFPTAKISAVKLGAERFQYATLTFENVIVTSMHQSANRDSGFDEQLTLRYTKATLTYVLQSPTGLPGTTTTGCWDLQTKLAC